MSGLPPPLCSKCSELSNEACPEECGNNPNRQAYGGADPCCSACHRTTDPYGNCTNDQCGENPLSSTLLPIKTCECSEPCSQPSELLERACFQLLSYGKPSAEALVLTNTSIFPPPLTFTNLSLGSMFLPVYFGRSAALRTPQPQSYGTCEGGELQRNYSAPLPPSTTNPHPERYNPYGTCEGGEPDM